VTLQSTCPATLCQPDYRPRGQQDALLKSHDGTNSHQMLASMFRFVSQNGWCETPWWMYACLTRVIVGSRDLRRLCFAEWFCIGAILA
jgi:hypothetical protein